MKKIMFVLAAAIAAAAFADVYIIDGERFEGEVHEEGGMKTLCTDEMCIMLPPDAVKVEEGAATKAPEVADGAAAKSALVAGDAASQIAAPKIPESIGNVVEKAAEKVAAVADEAEKSQCQVGSPADCLSQSSRPAPRMAQGYMGSDEFLAFLRGDAAGSAQGRDYFGGKSMWLVVIIIFLGGIAMNLTPCVLPMIPINLMIIGKSAARGAWYGLGIALAYGALGVMASLGGMAFGAIQSNPWFNIAVALVFVALALAMFGVYEIDLTKHRAGMKGGAFVMGMLSAVLAGACVAPILIAVLLLTADLVAQGHKIAIALPFVLGLGMALPWPFAGAGMQCLPKPGMWMTKVNKVFGVIVLGFAAWYGYLAYTGFAGAKIESVPENAAHLAATPATFPEALAKAKAGGRKVLVDCWATWCKNCAAMERNTLRESKVAEELKGYTVIKLQAENISDLKKLPGFEAVKGLPAFVVF